MKGISKFGTEIRYDFTPEVDNNNYYLLKALPYINEVCSRFNIPDDIKQDVCLNILEQPLDKLKDLESRNKYLNWVHNTIKFTNWNRIKSEIRFNNLINSLYEEYKEDTSWI